MFKKLIAILAVIAVLFVGYRVVTGSGGDDATTGQIILQLPTPAPAQVDPLVEGTSIVPTTPETPTVLSFSNLNQPQIDAKSWMLMDVDTGQILAQYEPDLRVEPASLTKLMTASLVFDALDSGQLRLDQEVMVSSEARAAPGSRMFIEVNTLVSVGDLLQGMIVQSGNDASIQLAQAVSGSVNVFVDRMNQRARAFGMHNTSYANPTGLSDPALYTTARDMSVLAQHIIKEHANYFHYFSQPSFTYNNITQANRNGLLGRNLGVDGLKTGYTSSAGYSLITTAQREGRRLLSIVIGASSEASRERANQALLDWGYANFSTQTVAQAGTPIVTPRVWEGKQKTVALGAKNHVAVTVPRGKEHALQIMTQIDQRLVAPLAQGQQVGMVQFLLDGHLLKRDPLVVIEEVPQAGFFGRLWDKIQASF